MALACKRGELKDCPANVKKLADSMSEEELEKFAKTSHEDLPERVKESIAESIAESETNVHQHIIDFLDDIEEGSHINLNLSSMTPTKLWILLVDDEGFADNSYFFYGHTRDWVDTVVQFLRAVGYEDEDILDFFSDEPSTGASADPDRLYISDTKLDKRNFFYDDENPVLVGKVKRVGNSLVLESEKFSDKPNTVDVKKPSPIDELPAPPPGTDKAKKGNPYGAFTPSIFKIPMEKAKKTERRVMDFEDFLKRINYQTHDSVLQKGHGQNLAVKESATPNITPRAEAEKMAKKIMDVLYSNRWFQESEDEEIETAENSLVSACMKTSDPKEICDLSYSDLAYDSGQEEDVIEMIEQALNESTLNTSDSERQKNMESAIQELVKGMKGRKMFEKPFPLKVEGRTWYIHGVQPVRDHGDLQVFYSDSPGESVKRVDFFDFHPDTFKNLFELIKNQLSR